MKYKKQLKKLEIRIKNWETNLSRKPGFRKPGSNKK